MGWCSFSNSCVSEEAAGSAGLLSNSLDSTDSIEVCFNLAIKYQPRPGIYSYWPGSGVVQNSVVLVERSVLAARNHLCGWNTF
jgi:hypothetical protein